MKYLTIILLTTLILCSGCGDDESEPTNTPAGGVIGQWAYESDAGVSILTIYKNNDTMLFQEQFPDGTVYIAEVEEVEASDSKTRRFNELVSFDGRYYMIDPEGNLILFDAGGKVRTVLPK
jgi:hypothetical protein